MAGGAIGSACRYFLQYFGNMATAYLPWGTAVANLFGSFLAGVVLAASSQLSENFRLMIVFGFLGALTTMSSFIAESFLMAQQGALLRLIWQVSLGVVGCFVFLSVGYFLGRRFV